MYLQEHGNFDSYTERQLGHGYLSNAGCVQKFRINCRHIWNLTDWLFMHVLFDRSGEFSYICLSDCTYSMYQLPYIGT